MWAHGAHVILLHSLIASFDVFEGLCAPGCSATATLGRFRSRLYGCIFTPKFFPPQQCSFFFFIHLIFDFSHLISCSCFTYFSLFHLRSALFFSLAKLVSRLQRTRNRDTKRTPFSPVPFLFSSATLRWKSHTFSFCKRGKSFDLTQSSVGTSQKCTIAIGWHSRLNSNCPSVSLVPDFAPKHSTDVPCPKRVCCYKECLILLQRKCKEQSDPNSAS